MNQSPLSFGQRMGETADLTQDRAQFIKATYAHLLYGVLAAVVGAYIGSTTPFILNLFTGWIGWIVAMLLLNFIPRIAIAVRHDPVKGFLALILDGFIAGIILGPIVYIAGMVATGHNLVLNAVLITALVFTAVTAMVWSSGKRYQAKRGLMTGIFVSLIGAIVLNMFMPMGILGLLISVGVGIMGVLILVYSTSDILHNPQIDSPIIGALMLFAGLFNVFTSILHILMAFAGGRD